MKSILVATDFSERSDRAIRRALLLAREFGAKVELVHVVDDDQAPPIVRAERDASIELLAELTQSLREIDDVNCGYLVVLGKPFLEITQVAREQGADLIVIGPHRRQLLRDILIGTTAERTIRNSDRPVLMANGMPIGPYRQVLATTDLSTQSEETFRTAAQLGLFERSNVSLLHVFSAPGASLMSRASLSEEVQDSYIAGERMRASDQLTAFIENFPTHKVFPIVKPLTVNFAETICGTARKRPADLIVTGTCGRSTLGRVLMGSVAEGVLRLANCDVLAIPPSRLEAQS